MNKLLTEKEWISIRHECGWEAKFNLALAKSEFENRRKDDPFYDAEIILKCQGCGATRGLRKECVYGDCYCSKEKWKNN